MGSQPTLSAHIHSQAKELVFHVSEYFLKEKQYGRNFDDASVAIYQTSAATKLSQSTIEKIRRDARHNKENNSPRFMFPKKRKRAAPTADFFDNFNECVLCRTVLSFYERKEIPTLEKINEEMKNKLAYPGGCETLRKVLMKIGFRFASVDG
ncbi:hypothetical protein E2C01_014102 [Portunus trituberculatus]|uniref:Uncharacterized protein n=1 Tax=Portunus trituberculatus TaxID=210409 RepID=A0A5B7DIW3_PORTR|nr:hypothetical protein [Portunus trituberculatus]